MRYFTLITLALLASACARAPSAVEPLPTLPAPAQRPSGPLIGLTAAEIVSRFGQPVLQVRDAPGVKMQWSRPDCVLDVFLYPPAGGGAEVVTHVEARRPSGDPIPNFVDCAARLQR